MTDRPTVGLHADPEGEVPWAMQLVLHVEKTAPPSRAALCAAAGKAVVRLLADERSAAGEQWGPAVARWTGGRIRKHARRARGVAWQRVELLPGVTAEHDGAQVRALVPTALDAVPRDVARLQLAGSELPDIGPDTVDPVPGGPIVVSVSSEPVLSLGKAAAAAGHAAQLAWLAMPAARRSAWLGSGCSVEVEHPGVVRWRALLGAAAVRVVDAGFTEVAPGSTTALARWR